MTRSAMASPSRLEIVKGLRLRVPMLLVIFLSRPASVLPSVVFATTDRATLGMPRSCCAAAKAFNCPAGSRTSGPGGAFSGGGAPGLFGSLSAPSPAVTSVRFCDKANGSLVYGTLATFLELARRMEFGNTRRASSKEGCRSPSDSFALSQKRTEVTAVNQALSDGAARCAALRKSPAGYKRRGLAGQLNAFAAAQHERGIPRVARSVVPKTTEGKACRGRDKKITRSIGTRD